MKSIIVLLTLFIGFHAYGSDLLNSTSSAGKTCSEEVQALVSASLGEEVVVMTYMTLTPGSYYQKYLATVLAGESKYSVYLIGQSDCDLLEIQKIKPQN